MLEVNGLSSAFLRQGIIHSLCRAQRVKIMFLKLAAAREPQVELAGYFPDFTGKPFL